MKKQFSIMAAVVALSTTPVTYADEEGISISGNVALASNYIWRGQTQTNNEPALSGGFDLAHDSGFYLGVWGSNVDFGADDNMELDYYGGFSGESGPVGYDLGYIAYKYPGGSGDFEEWYLGLSTTVGPVELGAAFSQGVDEATDNVELSASTDLDGIALSLALGDYDGAGEYSLVSLSKEMGGLDFSVAWSDYDADAGSASDQDEVTFTIAKSF